MVLNLFLKGWMAGLVIAMPFGPIGMICLQHSLVRGLTYGLAAGLGVAAADAIYGGFVGFGSAMLSNILITHQIWFQLAGSLFLCYLGLAILFTKQTALETEEKGIASLPQVFFKTFLITITNPLTLLSFVGIYTGMGIQLDSYKTLSALILGAGVFMGSAVWWLIMSSGASVLRKKINLKPSSYMNKFTGSLILLFAILAIFITFQKFN